METNECGAERFLLWVVPSFACNLVFSSVILYIAFVMYLPQNMCWCTPDPIQFRDVYIVYNHIEKEQIDTNESCKYFCVMGEITKLWPISLLFSSVWVQLILKLDASVQLQQQ